MAKKKVKTPTINTVEELRAWVDILGKEFFREAIRLVREGHKCKEVYRRTKHLVDLESAARKYELYLLRQKREKVERKISRLEMAEMEWPETIE